MVVVEGARGQGCIGCWWVPQDFPYIYSWLWQECESVGSLLLRWCLVNGFFWVLNFLSWVLMIAIGFVGFYLLGVFSYENKNKNKKSLYFISHLSFSICLWHWFSFSLGGWFSNHTKSKKKKKEDDSACNYLLFMFCLTWWYVELHNICFLIYHVEKVNSLWKQYAPTLYFCFTSQSCAVNVLIIWSKNDLEIHSLIATQKIK